VRLSQVLSNLLANAARYTPAGGTVALRARTEGTDAVFTVEDNGIGMEPGHIPELFEMFTQGPDYTLNHWVALTRSHCRWTAPGCAGLRGGISATC
jgi:K+-sensing histidine kinase KdpD